MQENILENLGLSNTLSEEQRIFIFDKIETIVLEKGAYLLKEGQVCTFIGLIAKGLLMFYNVADNGEERVCDFAIENQWVSQYKSMITSTKSAIGIRALEPTIVLRITYQNLKEISEKVPIFEKSLKRVIDNLLLVMMERNNSFQNLKAEQRYELFVKENFELIQRVPQYYLASFLGIAPQSLSRIRKK